MVNNSDNDVAIGKRLKFVREALGLTQKNIAQDANSTIKSCGNYEKGRRRVPRNILNFYANQGININWILNGEGVPFRYGERVKSARQAAQIEQKDVAFQLQISLKNNAINEKVIDEWETGKSPITPEYLQYFAKLYNVSIAYLKFETDHPTRYEPTLLGGNDDYTHSGNLPWHDIITKAKRDMLEKNAWEIETLKDSSSELPGDTLSPEDIRPAGELVTLPVFDIRICAGLGAFQADEEMERMGERTIERRIVGAISASEDKKPFIVKVSGDSMSEAGIRDGDEVVINPVQDVYSGDVAMVRFGEDKDAAIKWVYNLPDGSVELKSATDGFPVYRYTKEQQWSGYGVEVVGKVMAYTGIPKRG